MVANEIILAAVQFVTSIDQPMTAFGIWIAATGLIVGGLFVESALFQTLGD